MNIPFLLPEYKYDFIYHIKEFVSFFFVAIRYSILNLSPLDSFIDFLPVGYHHRYYSQLLSANVGLALLVVCVLIWRGE